ncbi:MAG: hypothetical protein V3U60_16000 [Gammaproteobacteria bacterium]
MTKQKTSIRMQEIGKLTGQLLAEVCQRWMTRDVREAHDQMLGKILDDDTSLRESVRVGKQALEMLQGLPFAKEEGAVFFRESDYAVVLGKEPEHWHCRCKETDGSVREAAGQEAVMMMAMGQIPDDRYEEVKERIGGRSPKEGRQLLVESMTIKEANAAKGQFRVTVMTSGFNKSKQRYYSQDMLQRDHKIFEGAKMFADHATSSEDKDRPERSVRDWVGTLSEVGMEGNQVFGTATVFEPWFRTKLNGMLETGVLDKMGLSHASIGKVARGTIEGVKTMVVESLVRNRSVDFVTEPGAGGGILFAESDSEDIDLIDLAALKEKRPDLIEELKNEGVETMPSVTEAEFQVLRDKNVSLEESVKERDTKVADLQKKLDESEGRDKRAAAQAAIAKAVKESKLPDKAKAMLIERHKDDDSAEGIDKVIEAEAKYLLSLSTDGTIQGLGETHKPDEGEGGEEDTAKQHKIMVETFYESFKREGKSDEEAKSLAESAASRR